MKIDDCNRYVTVATRGTAAHYKRLKDIIKTAGNALQCNFIGCNNLGIENNNIFFISGYTPERGLFIDKY